MYRLRRMPATTGVGPEIVYRALPNALGRRQWPVDQVPQAYISQLPTFSDISAAGHPGTATRVAQSLWHKQTGADWRSWVAKAWTEWSYELTRREIAPEGPSRLHALWAFADPLEAFAFTEETAAGYAVFEARIDEGVPWREVDMGAYRVPQLDHADDIAEAEPEVIARAHSYWRVDRIDARPEVLVGGSLKLVSARLDLLPWLRGIGVLG